MNMKTYIKPNVEIVIVETQALMDNSIQNVSGVERVEYSNDVYNDGYGDSRSFDDWD